MLYRPPTYEIERRALEVAAENERKIGPFRASIIPSATPAWYVVRTAPSQEDKTARFLEARAIGVFLPRFVKGARMVLRNERIDLSDRLVFPGKVFVFVWDVLAHWRRITACPGVSAIMVDGNERPLTLTDAQVGRIQILQYELAIPVRKRRKRYPAAADRITLSTASHWR